MTSAVLAGLVRSAFADVLRAADADPAALPATVRLRRSPGHGDYATGVALRAAGRARVPPLRLARGLADRLAGAPQVARAEVAGDGFVNLVLSRAGHADVLRAVLAEGVPGLPMPRVPADDADLTAARALCHADVATRCGVPGAEPAGRVDGAEHWGALVALLGADTARYALLRTDRPGTLPLRTLCRDHDDNPAYLVRFTHAHLRALLRHADDLGVPHDAEPSTVDFPVEHPTPATELTALLLDLAAAHDARGPVPVTAAAEQLAASWWTHGAGECSLPRGDEIPGARHGAGLAVCAAVATALAACLARLGVSAPERM